ncbi:hypothetical protein H4219_005946 [Mycoemilia scoparia]|uniref:Cation-transporting P-type ATPase N-terminal domain-containing protein n=1 Tax=Mycoemilia scoparia TaxID=417184 RepID=A0A9W7ZVD0_9FUNG|nr:hypothetical protein H4219_005946 [Mycoemilia scoparia]
MSRSLKARLQGKQRESFQRENTLNLERQLTIGYRTLSIQIDDPDLERSKGSYQQHGQEGSGGSRGLFGTALSSLGRFPVIGRVFKSPRSVRKSGGVDSGADNSSTAGAIRDALATSDYHLIDTNEIFTRFNTSPIQGLETSAIEARQARDGKNILSPPPSRWLKTIFNWLFSGFAPLVWIACLVVWISWKPLGKPPSVNYLALAIALVIVVAVQTGFNIYQDWSTSRIMSSITGLLPLETLVTRNGQKQSVLAAELVVGDLVHVKAGDKVPADLRLIEVSRDLKFDRSMLTGESDAVSGTIRSTNPNYLETKNIAAMGTNVLQGTATGVVVSTGDRTIMGRITQLATQGTGKTEKTLLQQELQRFVIVVAVMSLVTGTILIIVWAAWLRRSFPGFLALSDALVNSVGVIVAFQPEGLPFCVSMTLTLIARRMQKQRVLVKNLTTVETLGSVNIICSDKTGTLTCNRMSVKNCGFLEKSLATDEASKRYKANDLAMSALYDSASLCNGATFDGTTLDLPIDERKVSGDATDTAILRFAESLRPVEENRNAHTKLFEIPFNSKNKWMLTIQKPKDSNSNVPPTLYTKGAPDVLLSRCTHALDVNGNSHPLSEAIIAKITSTQQFWSGNGQRVLMLCRRTWESDVVCPFTNVDPIADSTRMEALAYQNNQQLEIVGMIGIVDPPRPEIPDVVDKCRMAGMRIFMVTGDFSTTAAAIARECHIITAPHYDSLEELRIGHNITDSGNSFKNDVEKPLIFGSDEKSGSTTPSTQYAEQVKGNNNNHGSSNPTLIRSRALVLTGEQLGGLDDGDWDLINTYDEIVFARTTPEQKLRIVNEFRKRDGIVAVTGDGSNDAPALKAAHIGVAMGAGSEVAKEAAAMILLDNNFSSILVAIKNGRLVFDNLKKVLAYLLPAGSFSELMPMLFNMLFGVPLPLSPFLMIVICMLTDVWVSISLMFEAAESDIMTRRPRNPKKDRLVNWRFFLQVYGFIGVFQCLFAHIIYFTYMHKYGGFSIHQLFFAYNKWTAGFGGKTQEELNDLLSTAETSYFVALVIMQWFNAFACRTRRLSLFQQNPLWGPSKNLLIFGAIIVALGVALISSMIPAINGVFFTKAIPVEFWFIPMGFGAAVLLLDEIRKFFVRRYPKGIIAYLAW